MLRSLRYWQRLNAFAISAIVTIAMAFISTWAGVDLDAFGTWMMGVSFVSLLIFLALAIRDVINGSVRRHRAGSDD